MVSGYVKHGERGLFAPEEYIGMTLYYIEYDQLEVCLCFPASRPLNIDQQFDARSKVNFRYCFY